jgi:DNA polymerase I-like protein with 3'-5' exonuclease and polymerase domains
MSTMPLFPVQTEWVAPQSFPNIFDAPEIAIDLETRDPHLENFGPGWPRGDGEIVGYAVAVEGWKGYYPVGHQGGGNLDRGLVERWMADVCKARGDKVMHNAAYDLGWLRSTGFEVCGNIRDTMIAAPLLDENRFSYSLNALGFDYLHEVKSERDLKQAAADFGVHPKKELWKLPAMYVGTYAEQDAALTLKLWQRFKGLLRNDEVEHIFGIESELLPVLVDMTLRGIPFDRAKCSRLLDELQSKEKDIKSRITKMAGMPVDVWAAVSIAAAFDRNNIPYSKTAAGAPSFTKNFLLNCNNELGQLIIESREVNKTFGTFLSPYLLASEKTGRVHPHINQLKSDEGGTLTGRLSMYSPNLQQVPSRHPTIGPMVRGLFLPEPGQLWASNDFSSQEPRLLVHYASLLKLPGSRDMVDAYRANVDLDFHQMVADMAGISRKHAKTIGLGLMYGMGKSKLAGELGLDFEEADSLINTFHTQVPFLKGTVNAVMKRVDDPASGGAIRTLLGRKCRFPLWEPKAFGLHKPLERDAALAEYGPSIKRAWTYKALNRLIQGSAADQTKAAMLATHKAGFRMMLQLHDELVFSVDKKEDAIEASEIMKSAVSLAVPSKVDVEVGPNWGESM